MTAPSDRSTTRQPHTPTQRGAARTPLWIAAAAVVGFLLGFGWQFTQARRAERSASFANHALEASRLEATLAAAVIEAQGGRYELGRQRTSDFFSGMQRRLVPVISPEAEASARAILGQRDPIITALARNDPASASVLEQVLTGYRAVIRQAGLDSLVAPRPR